MKTFEFDRAALKPLIDNGDLIEVDTELGFKVTAQGLKRFNSGRTDFDPVVEIIKATARQLAGSKPTI